MRQILILMLAVTAWAFQPAAQQANVERFAAQSNFVFQGTVTRLNASTEPQVPASPSTAVVRVDNVIAGDNMVSDIKGKEITVQLLSPRSVAIGRQLLFFSNIAVAGQSLAVKEVSHMDASAYGKSAGQVSDYVKRKPELDLQARVAGAELIVTGAVTAIRRSEASGPHPSEHDPEWTEATVSVQSTEKGSAPQTVTVWFPASNDIRWFRSPKFQIGQSGVFLLRRSTDRNLQGFSALHPLDFQADAERDHVRRLIAPVR
jgi:hypothetical protein